MRKEFWAIDLTSRFMLKFLPVSKKEILFIGAMKSIFPMNEMLSVDEMINTSGELRE